MKSYRCKAIFSILIVIVTVVMIFAACSEGKAVPVPENLAVDNNVLTWDAVSGATSYDVKVDDNVYVSNENKYTLPISDYETHEISVRANTYDGTGEYSDVIYYKRRQTKTTLPQLAAPRISMTSNRLMWNAILNNDGYYIYYNGKTILAPKNSTYYDLEITTDGRFEITMQTRGDGVSYATSIMSASYLLVVDNLQAPLQSLPKVDFTFNAQTRAIEWNNRYSAEVVSYEIYRDDESLPLVKIAADASKTKQSYVPMLPGGVVHYAMRLICENGLYAASEMNDGITFPIADRAPASLSVLPDEELGEYRIAWSSRSYADGYVAEIDGVDYPFTKNLSIAVPSTLAAGRHIVRVRTRGDNVYYADSLYSAGVIFYTSDDGVMSSYVDTPAAPGINVGEDSVYLIMEEVEHAASYRLHFITAGGEYELITDELELTLTSDKVGSRDATSEERIILSAILSSLNEGVKISLTAIPDSSLYMESLSSQEMMLTSNAEISAIQAPLRFRYDVGGFAWVSEEDSDVVYELELDGEIREMRDGDKISVSEGAHIARLRRQSEYALWSQEIYLHAPIDLLPPTDLKITSGILTYTASENAISYILYANGEVIGTVYPGETAIRLSSRISNDGRYVISMQAAVNGRAVSAPSEEVIYEKTDGAYGTAVKPYAPQSERELLSLMTSRANAYFRLKAGATYDFTSVEGLTISSLEFYGVIWGNGATLKLSLNSPLFSVLNGATISDLTIEISAPNCNLSTGGLLATQAYESTLSDLSIRVSGSSRSEGAATFGLLFYTADGLTLERVHLDCDFSIVSDESCDFAPIAYDLKGRVNDLSLTGTISLTGAGAHYAGVGVLGNMTVTAFAPSASVSVTGVHEASFSGCSINGGVSASGLNTAGSATLSAPISSYYGVSMHSPMVSDSTIGGTVLLSDAGSVTMYGVSGSVTSMMKNVTVSSTMKAVVSEAAVAAGFVSELGDVNSSGSAYTGRIEIFARGGAKVTAAGCAITAQDKNHSLRSAGSIKVEGGEATLSLGVITAKRELNLALDGHLILNGVSTAEAVGGAMTIDSSLEASGDVEILTEDCGSVTFGGVGAGTNRTVSLTDYHVYGSVKAERARIAGVYYRQEYRPSVSHLGLTVEVEVDSPDYLLAGAILGANGALYLPSNAAMEVALSGSGRGKIAGFAMDIRGVELKDITVGGSLSMEGEGDLYGIAPEAGDVKRVTSTIDLTARGAVQVYGLFDSVSNATGLTYRDGSVHIYSDHGKYNGIVKSASSWAIKDATISDLTFAASPIGNENSDLTLYGVIEQASKIEGTRVENVTYTVGGYDELTFGGIALDFSGTATDNTLNYVLTSDAKTASIGGAFVDGRGTITGLTLGGDTPLKLSSRGTTRLGGLCVDASNLTVSEGSTNLDLIVDLGASDVASVGGLASTLEETRTFLLTDHPIVTNILRKGTAGVANLGGAFGELKGMLFGASVEVDITDPAMEDMIGGIAAKSTNIAMRLASSLAKGRIDSPSPIGGLIGDSIGGNVERCATVLSLPQGENAGGLFSTVLNAKITSCYSLSNFASSGYGLFKRGENLSIDFVYYAGVAHAASIAGSIIGSNASELYADVALNDIPIAGSCSIDCLYRSFAYAYSDGELGSDYVTEGRYYPYLEALGEPLGEITATTTTLSSLAITGTKNLYTDLSLPRIYTALSLTISWVDEGGNLEIENDLVTVTDNGSGVLKGYLSGGVCVYRASYEASGFEPLSGSGSEMDPYLITDIKYFPHIAEYDGAGVYFKVAVEEESLTNANLSAPFTADAPFRGTIDFNGVSFISPTIGANGIFGYIDGGTVKGLVITEGDYRGTIIARSAVNATLINISISGSLQGEVRLIGDSTNSALEGITIRLSSIRGLDFSILSTMTGGRMERVSMRASVETRGDVTISLVGSADTATFVKVQAAYDLRAAGDVSLSLVREDSGSSFDSVLLIADAKDCNASGEVAGLIFTADGSSFTNSAALTAGTATIYPLVKEGAASYNGVKVSTTAAFEAPSGVSAFSASAIRGALSTMTGYEEGALYTPLGYDLLLKEGEETPECGFESGISSIELRGNLVLGRALDLYGSQPLACMVDYSYSGSGAVIEDGVLRITAASGNGTLTLTNVYGVSVDISVEVSAPYYLAGEGTEEDPYLISTFEEYLKMSTHPDGGYFRVTNDIAGDVNEPMLFNGVLMGSDVTITINLLADSLYSSGRVTILGTASHPIAFVIDRSASASAPLFISSANNLTLENVSVTVRLPDVAFEEYGNYGVLFGEIRGGKMENVSLAVLSDSSVAGARVGISAVGGSIGLVSGIADECLIRDLTVSGAVTLQAAQDVTFGVFGTLYGGQTTYRNYIDPINDIYEEIPYVERVSLSLICDLTAGDLTVGGFAGESNIIVVDVDGTVDITLVGDAIICGGLVGSSSGELSECDVVGSVDAEGASADIGGLVGVSTADITDSSANVTIDARVDGIVHAGGALGSGSGMVTGLTVTGDLRVTSDGSQEAVDALLALEIDHPILAAAGGAVGYLYGGALVNATVTLVEVKATADFGEDTLLVLAGGAAGYLREKDNLTVVGGGTVNATGGNSVYDESVAVYDEKE